MKLKSQTELDVTEFNIDGFLAISTDKIKNGGDLIFLQKNQVEFGTQWKIALDFSFGIIEIIATYEPKSKLNFSKLATYKAAKNYTLIDVANFENEKDELKKVATGFHKEYSDEYNKRLEGTKVKIPFPWEVQEQLGQFQERISSNLHKAIENIRKVI